MINNFTRPAEGLPTVEMSVYYDTDISQYLFNVNFKVLDRWRNGSGSLLTYDCDVEKIKDVVDVSEDMDPDSPLENSESILRLIREKSKDYDVITSYGHSQGDVCNVIFKRDSATCSKDIDNLLWDCPIGGVLTVDEKEYYICDFLHDKYVYDRDEIINNYNGPSPEYVKQFLREKLPKDLDYI